MAQPLPVRKKAVDLAGGPRRVGSRIRRAPPPPPEKKLTATELREREARVIVIGILTFAVTLSVLLLAAGNWGGWSPGEYVIVVDLGRR